MLTELPITRTLFAYVPLKGPWYRSTALTGQYEQRCQGMGQNDPTRFSSASDRTRLSTRRT